MMPQGPHSSRDPSGHGSVPSSRHLTVGGRVQRDVRLQAALALLVGITLIAVPLFIWGRAKHKPGVESGAASESIVADDAGPPTVIFGDAGASVAVDAGGRMVTFGEPKYLKCQDPGPGKTPAERCDHVGAIEDLVTKAIADRAAAFIPPLTAEQGINTVVDVNFKRKKLHVKDGKDGSSMPAAMRHKVMSCIDKSLTPPAWDSIGHAHTRYVFQFLTTIGPSPVAIVPPPPSPTTPR